MSFDTIIAQRRAKEIIRGQLSTGKVPHAYLFLGPDGVGRRRTALELAKVLNCLHPAMRDGGADPCDHCLACRRIDGGNHPDVQVIDYAWQARLKDEDPEKQTAIKIDAVRELQRQVSIKPTEGRWKVFVIEQAERLTLDAANCLLKTLEEPPAWTMIVLLARHKENLPATIVSRAQAVPFGPLPEADIAAWLILNAGMSDEDARAAAPLAEGSLAQAATLTATAAGPAAELAARLGTADLSTAELLRAAQDGARDADAFLEDLLAAVKTRFRRSPARSAALVEDVLRTRRLIERRASPLAALDALLLKLHRRGT